MLTSDQRRTLLSLARNAIAAHLAGHRLEVDTATLDPALLEPGGAFVTLTTREGDLRGCIGSIFATGPLYQSVIANAINAASRDPRFSAVSRTELDHLELEISVMGPLIPVSSPEEIEVGRDGLIVTYGRSSGLLLPQVATEHGWDRETFLQYTCRKAGLPSDAWRQPGCRLERFSAEVFGEQSEKAQ